MAVTASVAALPLVRTQAGEPAKKTGLGLVMDCCALRRKHLKAADPDFDLYEPLRLLEHCHRLGAGGVQVRLGVLDANAARAVRQAAEDAALYIEAIVSSPVDKADVERFEAEIKTAVAVGAKAARTLAVAVLNSPHRSAGAGEYVVGPVSTLFQYQVALRPAI